MSKRSRLLGRRVLIALFCLYLGGMAALYVVLPKRDFSENEKRVLAKLPALTASTATDGSFESGFEKWMSDHVPFRDALVGLHALYEQASGRNGLSGVIRSTDGRLLAAPAELDAEDIARKCGRIDKLAAATGLPTAVMLIPENGYMHEGVLPSPHATYKDAEAARLVSESLKNADFIWPEERFAELSGAELYYRADHHYTSRGAYEACRLYAEKTGLPMPARETYRVETVEGFHGSMYAKAGLWGTPAETVELWQSPATEDVTVTFDDRDPAHSLFFREHLAEMDKYPVFLDGNHALVTIDTGNEGERLLLVRDSFGHCFAPFAADCFSKIVLVDLRYYHKPVSKLAQQEKIDRILVLYGMDTFMTDSNFGWLK